MPPTAIFEPALDKILIGETVTVHVTLTDEDGNPASPAGPPPTWDALGGAGTVIVTGTINPLEATIEGVASGSDTLRYRPEDAWGNTLTFSHAVTVLAASYFTFTLSTTSAIRFDRKLLVLTIDGEWDVPITAVGHDERISDINYAGSFSNILWQNTSSKVRFVTAGSPEVESDSISGTLSVTVRSKEAGDDTITLTATNASGETVTAVIQVKVLGPVNAAFALV